MGSVRHTERHLHTDPPTAAELTALADDVDRVIAGRRPGRRSAPRSSAAIAVAGTATSLAAIDQRLDPYDPERVARAPAHRDACEQLRDMLAVAPARGAPRGHRASTPTARRRSWPGRPSWSRSLHAFGLAEVEVSEADILHGAALDAAGNALQ